jgi:hypothetical protein
MDTSRRDLIRIAAVAVAAGPVAAQAAVVGASKKFFTPHEYQLTDELTDIIIPTDDHSPGAKAAKVAAYIDFRLADDFENEQRQVWRDGLKLIDQLSREWHGKPFLESTPQQRTAFMERISRNEMEPKKPEEIFFRELKFQAARVYYTSSIGIHEDLNYKGNVMLKEFVGIDAGTVPAHVPEVPKA